MRFEFYLVSAFASHLQLTSPNRKIPLATTRNHLNKKLPQFFTKNFKFDIPN